MKKLFLSMVAVMIATMSYAQSTLVATLTHGDEIKMFYGAYALRDAHNAAANGDIINLSSGRFHAVDIKKAVTIRGAGADGESTTYIINNFYINIPTDVTLPLSFEGCRISDQITANGDANALFNVTFLKTIIQDFHITVKTKNCNFVNSRVYGMSFYGNGTVQFFNCEVSNFSSSDNGKSTATFLNCNIKPRNGTYASYFNFVQLINCILYNDGNSSFNSLPTTSSAWNCIAVGKGSGGVFNQLAVKQNCRTADFDIFQEGKGWNDLTDEAKAEYLGTDGTPVGYYGGILPFSLIPSYPRITKMNVANKTTADGKLSVEIEVSAAE